MSFKSVIFGRYKMIRKPLRIHAKSLSDALAPSKKQIACGAGLRRLCETRPTRSIMYAPLQVNLFQKSLLLTSIVQYKYLKSCSGYFYSPESDPPHKIMRYWLCYSIQLCFSFPPDHAGLAEMFRTTVVPVSKARLGGASP